jgi:hypothetical protein
MYRRGALLVSIRAYLYDVNDHELAGMRPLQHQAVLIKGCHCCTNLSPTAACMLERGSRGKGKHAKRCARGADGSSHIRLLVCSRNVEFAIMTSCPSLSSDRMRRGDWRSKCRSAHRFGSPCLSTKKLTRVETDDNAAHDVARPQSKGQPENQSPCQVQSRLRSRPSGINRQLANCHHRDVKMIRAETDLPSDGANSIPEKCRSLRRHLPNKPAGCAAQDQV